MENKKNVTFKLSEGLVYIDAGTKNRCASITFPVDETNYFPVVKIKMIDGEIYPIFAFEPPEVMKTFIEEKLLPQIEEKLSNPSKEDSIYAISEPDDFKLKELNGFNSTKDSSCGLACDCG